VPGDGGLGERRAGGPGVRVEGGLRGGQLVLAEWDDGPGFDLAHAPMGHGLDTLRLQLATLYGDPAGLEVRREEAGTRVVMWLPASESLRSPAMSRRLRAYLVDDIEAANLRLARTLEETGLVEVAGSTTQPLLALAEIPERAPSMSCSSTSRCRGSPASTAEAAAGESAGGVRHGA